MSTQVEYKVTTKWQHLNNALSWRNAVTPLNQGVLQPGAEIVHGSECTQMFPATFQTEPRVLETTPYSNLASVLRALETLQAVSPGMPWV